TSPPPATPPGTVLRKRSSPVRTPSAGSGARRASSRSPPPTTRRRPRAPRIRCWTATSCKANSACPCRTGATHWSARLPDPVHPPPQQRRTCQEPPRTAQADPHQELEQLAILRGRRGHVDRPGFGDVERGQL